VPPWAGLQEQASNRLVLLRSKPGSRLPERYWPGEIQPSRDAAQSRYGPSDIDRLEMK
jgi:hypothetical protein